METRGGFSSPATAWGSSRWYRCSVGRDIVFSSELKALLQHPESARELDLGAVDEYLTYGYVPAPRTILRGIQLLPGHSLEWQNGQASIQRYWHELRRSQPHSTVEAAAEELRALLKDSQSGPPRGGRAGRGVS